MIVETSGLTDPRSIICTLDQEFGRMFRVRLDSVVTVVDADVLLSEINASLPSAAAEDEAQDLLSPRQYVSREPASHRDGEDTVNVASNGCAGVTFASRIAESQFQCADVVLLNKIDLVTTAAAAAAAAAAASTATAATQNDHVLATLSNWVEKAVGGSGVRVLPCERGAVPLDAIMEVAQTNLFAEDLKGVHTHERAASNYTVLADKFGARRVGSRNSVSRSAVARAAIVPGGGFAQVSNSPGAETTAKAVGVEYASAVWACQADGGPDGGLHLAAFQDFVGEALPLFKLMRAKG